QRADPVRAVGRQPRTDQAAHGIGEQRGAFAAGRVEHGDGILRLLLERIGLEHALGQPGPAAVEQDQPAELRQAFEKATVGRCLPQLLDLGDPARHEEHVEPTLADDLVGDAGVPAARVACRRRDHQSPSISDRKGADGSTVAPVARTRSASQRSEVTTRTWPGSRSTASLRTISSSAESRRGRGACATSMTVERIGGDGGNSNTTVTSSPPAAAQRSSMSTSLIIAACRSLHHASGRVPITFIPSISQRTEQAYVLGGGRAGVPGGGVRPRGYRVPGVSRRVLILSWEYPPVIEGGLARHVRKLAEALVRQGVVVDVLTRGTERSQNGHLDLDELEGLTIHRVREPSWPRDLDRFVAWVQRMNEDMLAAGEALAQEGSYDLIHGHDWLVPQASLAVGARPRG